jgi:Uma2 family endonuclease
MTPEEFDRAELADGWRYEVIHGVLVVSPIPPINERDANDHLNYWLRTYRDVHNQGTSLDATLYDEMIKTPGNRRRADRVIWAGLGRRPRRGEKPTIIIDFISIGKRGRDRDYEEKRDEYLAIGVKEYWVIDRFKKAMTVFMPHGKTCRKRVIPEKQNYTTDLLPGFELRLAELIAVGNRWPEIEPHEW